MDSSHPDIVLTREEPAATGPSISDVPMFAAGSLLISSFLIAVGIPLYYMFGISHQPLLLAWYVVSAIALPLLAPLMLWRMIWGVPSRDSVVQLTRTASLYVLPALTLVVIFVRLELELALTGLAVMSFVAAVVVLVASGRFAQSALRWPVITVWVLAALFTPVIVLSLTQLLPHGVDAIRGWGIPMPVAAAGAYGVARGLLRSLP